MSHSAGDMRGPLPRRPRFYVFTVCALVALTGLAPRLIRAECTNAATCAWECDQKKLYLSCYQLGTYYSVGEKVGKSPEQAASYFWKACELGDGYLCALLGWELRFGATLPHDAAKADKANQLACDKGIPEACQRFKTTDTEPARPASPPAGTPETTPRSAAPPQPLPPPVCSGDKKLSPEAFRSRLDTFDRSGLTEPGPLMELTALKEPPKIIKQAAPDYPNPSFERKIMAEHFFVQGMSGVSMLEVIIDVDGNVTHPLLICTDSLRKSVYELEALKKWRYQPILLDGKPVRARKVISFNREISTREH